MLRNNIKKSTFTDWVCSAYDFQIGLQISELLACDITIRIFVISHENPDKQVRSFDLDLLRFATMSQRLRQSTEVTVEY